jgi:phage-related protein
MADTNLFEEMKSVLTDFKTFLDQNVGTIRPAVQTLAGMIPKITELIDLLIGLMDRIKTEIQNLNVNAIPGIGQVSTFTDKVRGFLTTAKDILPDDADSTVEEVLSVANVVSSLPSLDQVKQELIALIDAIKTHLTSLKPA